MGINDLIGDKDRIKHLKMFGIHGLASLSDVNAISMRSMSYKDTRAYTSVERALIENEDTETALLVSTENKLDRDLTIVDNIRLRIENGGMLNIPEGATLKINGSLDADPYQVFGGGKDVDFGGSSRIPVVYPQWFGATGKGLIDDSRAIQKAIDSLTSGGIVVFPPGQYLVLIPLELRNNVVLQGTEGGSVLTSTGTRGLVHGNGVTGAGLEHLKLTGGNDGVVFFNFSDRCFVNCCWLYNNANNGVLINSSDNCKVTFCTIEDAGKNGVYLYNGTTNSRVEGCNILSPVNKGISIFNGSTHNFAVANYLWNVGEAGIFINDSTDTTHSNYNEIIANIVYRSGVSATSGGNGIEAGLEQLGANIMGNLIVQAGYGRAGLSLPSLYGVSIHGTDVSVIGNKAVSSLYHGFYFYEASDCTCIGNTSLNSSQDSVGSYDGIRVHGTVTNPSNDNTFIGNRCRDKQGTKTQDYGIREAGTSDYNLFIANSLRGNISGGITTVGVGTIADHNMS